jgi:hypothetical protein
MENEEIIKLKEYIVLLEDYVKLLEEWKNRGALIINESNKNPMFSMGFSLGIWWADRPWKNK